MRFLFLFAVAVLAFLAFSGDSFACGGQSSGRVGLFRGGRLFHRQAATQSSVQSTTIRQRSTFRIGTAVQSGGCPAGGCPVQAPPR